jgi:hypothetical protein
LAVTNGSCEKAGSSAILTSLIAIETPQPSDAGLGGRDRRAASAAERARINVTRAIKVAIERIAEHNPALATLLTGSIRTGTFCSYTPDSRLPASWQL